MKNFSLKDLIQLRKGQLLLHIALLNNTSKDKTLVNRELIDIEEMISNLEFNIDVKKREIELKG